MKFSVGDPVYIKSNQEEGQIIEFISIDMVSVRVGKSEYHVYLDDLEHPYLRWFLDKSSTKKQVQYVDQLHPEKKSGYIQTLPTGVYLVFFPTYVNDGFDEQVERIKIYLYNETLHSFRVNYACRIKQQLQFEIDTQLPFQQQFYLHDLTFDEAALSPIFQLRLVDQQDERLDNELQLSLKPKKLFEYLSAIRYENRPFFHMILFDKPSMKAREEVKVKHQIPIKKSQKEKSHFDFEDALKKSKYEIDLHIEKLVADFKGMSNSVILQIQLKECQSALDLAYATHQNSIVLIHGVGKGKLRDEIHLLLNQTNFVASYVYDYDVRYGYGATKVFFAY